MDSNILLTLADGSTVTVSHDKLYRIGLSISSCDDRSRPKKRHKTESISTDNTVETFYGLTPHDIKKYIKSYDGELIYVAEM